jgi:hypothetical protein
MFSYMYTMYSYKTQPLYQCPLIIPLFLEQFQEDSLFYFHICVQTISIIFTPFPFAFPLTCIYPQTVLFYIPVIHF